MKMRPHQDAQHNDGMNGNRTVVVMPAADMLSCKDTGFHVEMLRMLRSNLVALVVLERPQGPRFAPRNIPRAILQTMRHVMNVSHISRAASFLESLLKSQQRMKFMTIEEVYTWKGKPTLRYWSLNDPNFSAWLRENEVSTVVCKNLSEHPKANLLTSVQQCLRVRLETLKQPREDAQRGEGCEYILESLGHVPEKPTELVRLEISVVDEGCQSFGGSPSTVWKADESLGLQEKDVVVFKKEDAAGELTASFLLGQAYSLKAGLELTPAQEAGAP